MQTAKLNFIQFKPTITHDKVLIGLIAIQNNIQYKIAPILYEQPINQIKIPAEFILTEIIFTFILNNEVSFILKRKISEQNDFITPELTCHFVIEKDENIALNFGFRLINPQIQLNSFFKTYIVELVSENEYYEIHSEKISNLSVFTAYFSKCPVLFNISAVIKAFGMEWKMLIHSQKLNSGVSYIKPGKKLNLDQLKLFEAVLQLSEAGQSQDLLIPLFQLQNTTEYKSKLTGKIQEKLIKKSLLKNSFVGVYAGCFFAEIIDYNLKNKIIYKGNELVVINNKICLQDQDFTFFDYKNENFNVNCYDQKGAKSQFVVEKSEIQEVQKCLSGQLNGGFGQILLEFQEEIPVQVPVEEEPLAVSALKESSVMEEIVQQVPIVAAVPVPQQLIKPVESKKYQVLHLKNVPQNVAQIRQKQISIIEESPALISSFQNNVTPLIIQRQLAQPQEINYSEIIKTNQQKILDLEDQIEKATQHTFKIDEQLPITIDDQYRKIFNETAKIRIPSLIQTKQQLFAWSNEVLTKEKLSEAIYFACEKMQVPFEIDEHEEAIRELTSTLSRLKKEIVQLNGPVLSIEEIADIAKQI